VCGTCDDDEDEDEDEDDEDDADDDADGVGATPTPRAGVHVHTVGTQSRARARRRSVADDSIARVEDVRGGRIGGGHGGVCARNSGGVCSRVGFAVECDVVRACGVRRETRAGAGVARVVVGRDVGARESRGRYGVFGGDFRGVPSTDCG